MTESVSVRDMPAAWFDRPQYRPRLEAAGIDQWFLLSEAFVPELAAPRVPPREPRAGRAALRAAFEETYEAWRLPRKPATEAALARIASAGTAAVVTGQQPGFLGGPLHTLYKALTAVQAARRYEAETSRPCEAVFWVAGDDHDFEEVRDARFPGPGGGEAVFRFPGEADRRPVADYAVDGGALEVLDAAGRHFGSKRFGETARALIGVYAGRGLAGGFAALLGELLGSSGLLLLDPAAIRPLASRIVREVIEHPGEIVDLVEQGRSEVAAKGLEPLVAARLPLFLLRDGRRHHLSPAAGGLQIDGTRETIGTLEALRALNDDPRSFSHGALLRPIVQDEALPCVLSVGGPAEVGYFAQLGPLASRFGFERPRISLRLNGTILDGKSARAASKLSLDAIAAARSPEALLPPEDEPESLKAVRDLAAEAERTLGRAVAETSLPAESNRLGKRAREISFAVASFAERLARTRASRRTGEIEEARKLWNFILPDGVLQERRWGALHFIARHGTRWIDELLAAIAGDPFRVAHRWILFEDETPSVRVR